MFQSKEGYHKGLYNTPDNIGGHVVKNKKDCAKCDVKSCFAYHSGSCIVLYDNDFGGRKCPFYKSKAQRDQETKIVSFLGKGFYNL